ncbi:MAG TPA: 2-dehydro-3-deoxy-6-phosphogalactonate aldolase [Steroidobacteraceae bacterium]|jgi:2-dehydro-3-deoxyphosphogalactonate aldolase|nr:2-dehydro-3-deoxy-6-phosphogalactonate aldolase [Steroidobacteraceae bacterium]
MRLPIDTLWREFLDHLPLIAILRGIQPAEAVAMAQALCAAGFRCLEVPLNSPAALESIARIRDRFEDRLLIGAGTVLNLDEVNAAFGVGALLVVSPNSKPEVIRAVKSAGMISIPGFATPTEAFAALDAGADALKLFPAEQAAPAVLRAFKAVLPPAVPVIAVGGISSENMASYRACGAAGFGIGTSLYRPGASAEEVHRRATEMVAAWHECQVSAQRMS